MKTSKEWKITFDNICKEYGIYDTLHYMLYGHIAIKISNMLK